MKCYKVGACGLYGIISCYECPANNSDYQDVEKAQAEILKMIIKNYNELKATYDELVRELEEAKKDLSISNHCGKSCDLCCENDFDKFERGHSPDNHGFIISQNGLYYCDSELGWEGIRINLCPICGRRLNDDLL